jgi:hypothetical protein
MGRAGGESGGGRLSGRRLWYSFEWTEARLLSDPSDLHPDLRSNEHPPEAGRAWMKTQLRTQNNCHLQTRGSRATIIIRFDDVQDIANVLVECSVGGAINLSHKIS